MSLALQVRSSIRKLAKDDTRHPTHPPHLPSLSEQPFDSLLLDKSPLYRRSRELFLSQKGRFEAALLSSPRSLSGSILLENRIQYSPIASELVWTAQDPREDPERLLELRSFTTSVFHEQNHRILWNFLPTAPTDPDSQRRVLHLAESLVVGADMALSDRLGKNLADPLYLTGAIYDPGTSIRSTLRSAKNYRRYLLVAIYATYLNLELCNEEEVAQAIRILFGSANWVNRACRRALSLDRMFIVVTNPDWQERNSKAIKAFFKKRLGNKKPELLIPKNPLDHGPITFWAEKWLDHLEAGQ